MKNTPFAPQPDPAIDADMARLLDHTLAAPLPDGAPGLATTDLRERLSARAAASRSAEAAMITARLRRSAAAPLAAGIAQRLLYQAAAGTARRPGEPLRVRLIELDAGAMLHGGLLGPEAELRARHREWLVLAGELRGDREALAARDYHVSPAGQATPTWTAHAATRLFLRESDVAAVPGDVPFTVRDAGSDWPDFAPGIQRRVLWQRDGMAAMLYRGRPGIAVPQHTHGHDEDCLMVEGELFLDDQLLQAGDYQLAPAGTGHRITATDVGAVIYAHGDLDLRFVG